MSRNPKPSLRDDRVAALEVLKRHAEAEGVSLDAAVNNKIDKSTRARRAAWRELHHRMGWRVLRIARAFGMDHGNIGRALQGCPMCGEPYVRAASTPNVMCCGIATMRAYHHDKHICVQQVAFVLRGEEVRL